MKPDWPCWFVHVGVLLCACGVRADEVEPKDAVDERLRQVIEQVQKAEERYRNLETVVRITSKDEFSAVDVNDRQNVSKSDETCYTLQQGDLFLFKWRQAQTFAGAPIVSEQLAAYDGETTRSIVYGNSVNIFAGRHEPSQLFPPHTWCLRPWWINYPLSVYLQGTEAIKKHPKAYNSPVQRGRVFELAKVEVSFVGDEEQHGLKCVRLQSRRWNRESDPPQVADLWLARDRNYLCAKADVAVGEGPQGTMHNEIKTSEWSEIEPNLWLPKQIKTTYYITPQNGGNQVARRSETLRVEKVSAGVNYPRERFANVKLPEELPVYKIDADGHLEGSALPTVKAPAGDPHELARIIAALKRHEARYPQYDISTTETYRAFEGRAAFAGTRRIDDTERTISLPGKLYYVDIQQSHGTATFGLANAAAGTGSVPRSDTVSRHEGAWDGEWIRSFSWHSDQGELPVQPSWASLQKGGPKGLATFRPHTAIFSDHRLRQRLLSDYLTAEYWDEHNRYRHRVEYVGDETVNGLHCAKLRLGSLFGDETEPKDLFYFLWLARDRNYLPVRTEWAELAWSDRLPTGVAQVDELREVSPGIWFPYHVVDTAYDKWYGEGIGSGHVLINWQRERTIDELNLEPDVSDELFSPSAPSGTWVYVIHEAGTHLGRFRQKGDGPAKVDDDKYQVMAEIARVDWRDQEDRKRRQATLDALVGTPWPEFGKATWLNGPPLADESLNGKVLLIEFCAEWSQSCYSELEKLGKADRDLAGDGVTVIAVHTAGSDNQDIEDLANELDLNFSIYVDTPQPGGNSRWGWMFEKLFVRELPHAFVVGRDGKIAAHGGLDQMIAQAQSLAEKK